MIKKKDIEGLCDGQRISGFIVFQNIEERLTKSGTSSYLMGNLQCQGTIPYKVWSNAPCFTELKADTEKYLNTVCEINGKINVYEGNTSLIIESCRMPMGNNIPDVLDFFESKYDSAHFWNMLHGLLEKNCSSEAMSVFELVMGDYKSSFLNEFAAVSHHDSCKSGLIGHSTKVTKLAGILNMYPSLVKRCGGKDVLYVGCALHDIGKVLEYSNGSVTKEGLHISHMVIGAMILSKYESQIVDLMGEEFYYNLISIVSGHAGEFGDRPRTVAAYVVHLLDNMEAHLTSLNELSDNPQQIFFEGFKLN